MMTPEEGLKIVLDFCTGRKYGGKTMQCGKYYIYTLSDGYSYVLNTDTKYIEPYHPDYYPEFDADNLKPVQLKLGSRK